jgi:hypothetical protein
MNVIQKCNIIDTQKNQKRSDDSICSFWVYSSKWLKVQSMPILHTQRLMVFLSLIYLAHCYEYK